MEQTHAVHMYRQIQSLQSQGWVRWYVPISSTPILSTPISSTPVLLLLAEDLYMDGTFQIAPCFFYQVLTIYVFKHGQRFVVLPSSLVSNLYVDFEHGLMWRGGKAR